MIGNSLSPRSDPPFRRHGWLGLVLFPILYFALGGWLGDWLGRDSEPVAEVRLPVSQPSAFPFLPHSYLDRTRIDQQRIQPPQLVTQLLWPTIGSPYRVSGDQLPIVLADQPVAGWTFHLLARSQLDFLDNQLYTLPLPANGDGIMRQRIARTKAESKAEKKTPYPRVIPEGERAGWLDYGREIDSDLKEVLRRITEDSDGDTWAAVRAIRRSVKRFVNDSPNQLVTLGYDGFCSDLGVGEACLAQLTVPADLPSDLYLLIVRDADGVLVDLQFNAVYKQPARNFRFVVAADLQWGDDPRVARRILTFVNLLNSMNKLPEEERPEFVVLAGDIVDCQFGSADTLLSQIFAGARRFPHEYRQAWLALAALRVPAYMIPGNHDGYRFEDAVGKPLADGLLLHEATFGPLYHSFVRGRFKFLLLNSYDLPAEFRTMRRSRASSIVESVSAKANVLNWGGGIRSEQYHWLSARLNPPQPAGRYLPVILSHHDPRGGFPVLKPEFARGKGEWSIDRHLPLMGKIDERDAVLAAMPPHASETQELHAGFYSPLRNADSEVRSNDWFEMGLAPAMPLFTGYPGWSRYQQEWHTLSLLEKSLDDLRPLDDPAGLIAPYSLLRSLVRGKVRAIFKGHDNLFARTRMATGSSIFGEQAEDGLGRFLGTGERKDLRSLRLFRPLAVYHTAALADNDATGNGFYWVEASGSKLTAYEVDHF